MTLHIANREGYTIYRPRECGNVKRFIIKRDKVSGYDVYEYPKTGPQVDKLHSTYDTLDAAIEQLK